MHGPVFGQKQFGAAGEAEAQLALSMSAEAGTRTQGWDRDSVGLPGQDADTTLLSIAGKRLKYRKIRSQNFSFDTRSVARSISFQISNNHLLMCQ